MKNRLWIPLSFAALLGSCTKEAPDSKVTSALDLYAEARGMPSTEPLGPDKHYRAVGDLVFYLEEQEIPQDAELLLGGSARMQFTLKREGFYPNTFLLASPEACWVRYHNKDFEEYDSLDLWKESIMRWHTLRFPWGWKTGDLGEFAIETELGTLSLEVNEQQLPARISLRNSHVALSDWQRSGASGTLYPMHWDWTYEGGRRVESFTSLQDHALFVDSAFTPKSGKRDRTYLLSPQGAQGLSGEFLDFLSAAWQSVSAEAWAGSSTGAPGHWYEHQGARRYVFEPGLETQPGAKWIDERDWLVWSTLQKASQEEALAYLQSILPQLHAVADGDLWSHLPEHEGEERRVFVLPVLRQ